MPSCRALADEFRPPPHDPEDHEPGTQRQCWQHKASSRVEREFRETHLFHRLADHERALVRSQSGTGAGMFLSTTPTSPLTRIESHLFRFLLFRRLRLPIPLSKRFWWCCRRQIDVFGHHRAACAQVGVLGRRGFALESVAARICREGRARVTTSVMVGDLDLGVPNITDCRRLDVVVQRTSVGAGHHLGLTSPW